MVTELLLNVDLGCQQILQIPYPAFAYLIMHSYHSCPPVQAPAPFPHSPHHKFYNTIPAIPLACQLGRQFPAARFQPVWVTPEPVPCRAHRGAFPWAGVNGDSRAAQGRRACPKEMVLLLKFSHLPAFPAECLSPAHHSVSLSHTHTMQSRHIRLQHRSFGSGAFHKPTVAPRGHISKSDPDENLLHTLLYPCLLILCI